MPRFALMMAIGALAPACLGAVGDEEGGPGHALPPGAAPWDIPLPEGPPPAARLHKLTAVEVANSVRDLLGIEVRPSDLEPDQERDGSRAVAASLVSVSPLGVDRYESVLVAAAERALGDATRAAKVVSCVPGFRDTNTESCLTLSITGFGRQAFRRPLTPAERERYVALAEAIAKDPGGTNLIGLQY